MSNLVQILEEDDVFWIRFPQKNESLLNAVKTLIPYNDRKQERGLGWHSDVTAWAFPMEYENDVLLLLEHHAPSWTVDVVDQL